MRRSSQLPEDPENIPHREMSFNITARMKALNQDQTWLGAGEVGETKSI